jgi:hypothetical protein
MLLILPRQARDKCASLTESGFACLEWADGVDFRAAFQDLNVSRPIAKGQGASAGTQEIVLSSNGGDMGDQVSTTDASNCIITGFELEKSALNLSKELPLVGEQ